MFGGYSISQEDCANGIDDDTDGLVDLNDPDCDCAGFTVSGSNVITNPSFEDMLCCPTTFGQLTCADTWLQATTTAGGFADYWNTCGLFSSGGLLTDAVLPAPDGNGWAGFLSGYNASATHNEYLAKCLTGTLVGGTSYTLNLWMARGDGSLDLNLTVYGTPTCTDLPWTTNTCPDGIAGWQELGATMINFPTYGDWYAFSLTFTPSVDINAVAIGGNCITSTVPATDTYNYYYADQLELIGSGGFTGGNITESGGGLCSSDNLTASIGASGGAWQWYLEGVALVGETASLLDVTGTGAGNYSAVYTIADSCHQLDYTLTAGTVNADFSYVDLCFGDLTSFTDLTTFGSGSIVFWLWDLSDGGFSFLQNPTHAYSSPGSYSVTLTATHDSGCESVKTIIIDIDDCYAGEVDNAMLESVVLYPNPANGHVSIDLKRAYNSVEISITDALGKSVYAQNYLTTSLIEDINLPADGVYFVNIRINDSTPRVIRIVNE